MTAINFLVLIPGGPFASIGISAHISAQKLMEKYVLDNMIAKGIQKFCSS